MKKIIYFDHAATTYVKEEVLKEMLPYFNLEYGNASSSYIIGRGAKKAIKEARNRVARAICANPKEIYFTSGGSESDNLAIKGIAYANKDKGNHIITSKIEHPAVLNTCKTLEKQGYNITYLNVDENGLISLEELENSINPKTILISVMFANNEIGTIEPIEKIGKIAKKYNIIFHTDSVQAVGNIKIDVNRMNIDLLSMSGHKFYAPKGIGALYIRAGIKCEKLQDGGHQEKNLRAGTENVPGIVGIGKAIELANTNLNKYSNRLLELRNYYEQEIRDRISDIKINANEVKRLPGTSNISFKNVEGEDILFNLDEKGICCSSGSACSTGNDEPSHVLTAIGLNYELAKGALRITFGEENTKEDIDYLVNCLEEIIVRLRKNKL